MATSCASRRTWAFAKQADHAPDGNITAFGLLDRAQLRGGQNKGTGHACILRSLLEVTGPILLLSNTLLPSKKAIGYSLPKCNIIYKNEQCR
jgi:hypothetical protein